MRSQERRLLSFTLAFAITTQSVWPVLSYAHISSPTPTEPGVVAEVVPAGQPRSSIPADQFLLWMQTVYPSQIPAVSRLGGEKRRVLKLSSLIQKTDAMIKAAQEGTVAPTRYEIVPDELDDQGLKAAVVEYIDKGRRIDTPLFLWNRQKNVEELVRVRQLLTVMADRWVQGRNSGASNPTDAPLTTKTRHLNWWELKVHLQGGDRQIGEFALKDTGSMLDMANSAGLSCSTEDCRFNLKVNNNFIHSFGIPIRTITNVGPYIVFTHPDSYDAATGFQYLSFIDLETYEGSLGNEDLPVFRYLAPIQGKGPATRLSAAGDKIYADGVAVANVGDLRAASALQQTVLNLEAHLLDPNEWKNILSLVDSFDAYTHKMTAIAANTAVSDMENRDKIAEGFRMLGQGLSQQLKGIRDTRQAVETVDKLTKQMDLVGQSLKTITERKKGSHLYMGGVSRLIKKLWSPKPYAAQIVKQAVGVSLARAGLKAPEGEKLNWLYRLADRPFLNAGVLGYTMMALGAPESFHNHVDAVLNFGSGLLNYFVFAGGGIGESIAVGTQKTMQPFYSFTSTMWEQYGANGNWMRTAVGVPVFFGFLLSIYFSGHVVFNIKELWKDMQRPEYKNFRDRQAKFYNAYFRRIAEAEAKERKTGVTFTAEEEEKIAAFIEQRRKEQKSSRQSAMGKRLFSDRNGVSYLALAKQSLKPLGDGIRQAVAPVGTAFQTMRGWFSNRATQVEQPTKVEQHDQDTVAATVDQATEDLEAAVAEVGKSEVVKKANGLSEVEFKSYWSALSSFMFSMPALDLTLGTWIRKWNSWAGWRFCTAGWCSYKVPYTDYPFMFRPKPVSLALRVTYPRLFETTVAARKGQVTLPTDLNGGRITRMDAWGRRFASMAKLMTSTGPEFDENLRPSTGKYDTAVAAFEDQIIDVEQKITKIAFQKALSGLVNFATDPKDLKVIFGGHGLTHLTDSHVKELSRRSQTYLRTHFESIYDAAMNQFLREVVAKDDTEDQTRAFFEEMARKAPDSRLADQALAKLDSEDELVGVADDLSAEAIKSLLVASAEVEKRRDYGFDLAQAEKVVLAVADNPEHAVNAKAQAGKLPDLETLLNSTRYNFVASIDPLQNRSMARYAQVEERLDLPLARSRAVRAEVAKLLVTLPLDVGFKLLLTAGLVEGVFKPIQNDIWGPNSTFYLSHTAFYGVMGTGFAIGMMADAWMKLQQDARQDNLKLFGQIPKGEDAERSFFRYYMKQMGAPENSMWENYKYSNFLSFWNTPAAIVNLSLFYMIFMGRVDVSLLAGMYMVGYMTPFSAFGMKVDQAFERAVHYASRGVSSDKWLAHPDVQAMMSPEAQRLRNRYQLLNDIQMNVQGNWMNNIDVVANSYGPRGLVRSAFAGLLPEEMIINGIIRPVNSVVERIPLVGDTLSSVLDGCERILTNGNADLTKLKK